MCSKGLDEMLYYVLRVFAVNTQKQQSLCSQLPIK